MLPADDRHIPTNIVPSDGSTGAATFEELSAGLIGIAVALPVIAGIAALVPVRDEPAHRLVPRTFAHRTDRPPNTTFAGTGFNTPDGALIADATEPFSFEVPAHLPDGFQVAMPWLTHADYNTVTMAVHPLYLPPVDTAAAAGGWGALGGEQRLLPRTVSAVERRPATDGTTDRGHQVAIVPTRSRAKRARAGRGSP